MKIKITSAIVFDGKIQTPKTELDVSERDGTELIRRGRAILLEKKTATKKTASKETASK